MSSHDDRTQPGALRLGIVGCGEIAPAHARAAAVCHRTRLMSSYDIDLERARAFARRFGGTVATSVSQLLRQCDAVIVCTPPATHASIVLAACAAGRHVLCEKELAPDPQQCDAMLEAARRAAVRFAVGFRLRHDPFFQQVRSVLQAGRIGEIMLIHLWLPRSLDSAAQLSASAFPAGVTVGHGCHGYDLLHFFMGRPDALTGLAANQARRLSRSDDTSLIGFRWAFALGTLVMPWSATPTDLDRRIEAFGSHGHLSADYLRRTIRLTGPDGAEVQRWQLPPLDVPSGRGARLDFVQQLDNFAAACQEDAELIAPARVGAEAVAALTDLRGRPDWLGQEVSQCGQ